MEGAKKKKIETKILKPIYIKREIVISNQPTLLQHDRPKWDESTLEIEANVDPLSADPEITTLSSSINTRSGKFRCQSGVPAMQMRMGMSMAVELHKYYFRYIVRLFG